MWWSRRPHASEMSYRSSPDGLGPQSELAVLPRPPNVPDAPRRARVSPVRSNRAASRPSLTPNGISPRRHHTHLALDGLPSFQRRGSPDSWCVDDVPCPPAAAKGVRPRRRAAIGCAATMFRRRASLVSPQARGAQGCSSASQEWCVQLRLRATAARFRLSAHDAAHAACVGRVLA